MDRRRFFALCLCAAAGGGMAPPYASPVPPVGGPSGLLGASGDPNFLAWLDGFLSRMVAQGVSRSVLAEAFSGISPDPRVAALDARQPEFVLPVSTYVSDHVTGGAIAEGQSKEISVPALSSIIARFGPPGGILMGVWAMESGFGADQGSYDVVRCLATLAAGGRRRPWAEGELEAALKIIASGEAARSRLTGSWAGAMGQTQLVPSAFLAYAVSAAGRGPPDIWDSPADALASAANLLRANGWRRGEGWAREVVAPPGFDWSLTEGPARPPSWWRGLGLITADGRGWSPLDAAAPAILLVPAGAAGPAFLAFPNHFVIRSYNDSIAYALAVGFLADRIAGGGPLVTPWPVETPLSLAQRLEAQTALTRLGFNPGPIDGLIGVNCRRALRAWQKSQGLIADGYLSPQMVARLGAALASLPGRTVAPA
ncbi:MAG: lytic murein transglycosylase [Caulobacteraceae bacterium]